MVVACLVAPFGWILMQQPIENVEFIIRTGKALRIRCSQFKCIFLDFAQQMNKLSLVGFRVLCFLAAKTVDSRVKSNQVFTGMEFAAEVATPIFVAAAISEADGLKSSIVLAEKVD
ncbi:expressed unknown protein [Seminavis robusta]|uniref:Uncharacterized protein n=1 Tax=Seminavis robusta TaxID=568900 RepID=A0A9N8DT09_9STRA|nr:expressed unknown protein [Seminavis robusta]|eukprot:Sro257_g100851.1  (116) ;mRNA; f:30535-30882